MPVERVRRGLTPARVCWMTWAGSREMTMEAIIPWVRRMRISLVFLTCTGMSTSGLRMSITMVFTPPPQQQDPTLWLHRAPGHPRWPLPRRRVLLPLGLPLLQLAVIPHLLHRFPPRQAVTVEAHNAPFYTFVVSRESKTIRSFVILWDTPFFSVLVGRKYAQKRQ
jgi:hypothetical protein